MKELPQELLAEMVRRLAEALRPSAIYLFGSHACGTPDRDSDVDFLVVVPDTDEAPRELAYKGRSSLWGLCLPVDVVVCTEAEMKKWSGVPCNLLHTVAEKGRPVYPADD